MIKVSHRLRVFSIAAIMLVGVVGEALILFLGNDPVLRLRVGMFLLGMIAWPLFYAARHFPAGGAVLGEPARRRFSRLRRWTRELLREISRLNWTVVDVDRGFRNREAAKIEIDTIETRLYEIIEEIKDAAGHPDLEPKKGHEQEIALRREPLPRWTPDPRIVGLAEPAAQ